MKKLTSLAFITTLTCSSVFANEHDVRTYEIATDACKYASQNKTFKFFKLLKDNHIKTRTLYQGVKCNGMNLLEFAEQHNSVKFSAYLIKRIPKSSVAEDMKGFTNVDVIKVATSRIG